ncbi:hypothetical protein Agub_g11645, partial [Astrephomene gubernaculifera]
QTFRSQELCNLLWALAVMRHRPPGDWLGGLMGQLYGRAPGLTAQDVAHVCWSLAVLRVRPGLPLLQRLLVRALGVRRELTPQALILTLWGLSRLRVALPERAVALLLQGGMGASALAAAAEEAGVEAPTEAAPPGVRHPPPPPVHAAANAASSSSVQMEVPEAARASSVITPGDLAGAAVVLARCRHMPPRRWLARWYGAVAAWRQRFTPTELATLLYGIAVLGLRPMGHWLDLMLTEVERHVTAAAGAADPLVATVAEVARWRRSDGLVAAAALGTGTTAAADGGEQQTASVFTATAAAAAGARCRCRLSATQLTLVLWSVARLGHPPPPAWVGAVAGGVAERLEEFNPREAAATLRALSQLMGAAAERRRAEQAAGRGGTGRRRRHHLRTRSSSSSSPYRSSGVAAPTSGGASLGGGRGSLAALVAVGHLSMHAGGSAGDGMGAAEEEEEEEEAEEAGEEEEAEEAEEEEDELEALVSGLVARLAESLPERCLYGTLRAASLARSGGGGGGGVGGGGVSYATAADQQLLE